MTVRPPDAKVQVAAARRVARRKWLVCRHAVVPRLLNSGGVTGPEQGDAALLALTSVGYDAGDLHRKRVMEDAHRADQAREGQPRTSARDRCHRVSGLQQESSGSSGRVPDFEADGIASRHGRTSETG